MSRTFSANCGSIEGSNVEVRCGCKPKALQMRTTAVWDSPEAAAMLRVLQCVASGGLASSIICTTRSTSSSEIVRGAPQRCSSRKPSTPRSANLFRQRPTVSRLVPSLVAIETFVAPFAVEVEVDPYCRKPVLCHTVFLNTVRRNETA